jgi:hypothetical protein
MLARAYAAKLSARWLVAESCYGRAHHVRRWLEDTARAQVVGLLPAQVVADAGQRQRATALAHRAPGPRVHDWAVLALSAACAAGMGRWLLVRRAPDDPADRASCWAYGPGCGARTSAAPPATASRRTATAPGARASTKRIALSQRSKRRVSSARSATLTIARCRNSSAANIRAKPMNRTPALRAKS